ncbi:MAG: DUF1573 domain-containing protein [Azospira oryzae]|nr:hypothetical protein [Cytophaga sp.]PZR38606.1 MAG: DUF1573 domain-containing protein [Azospira oryzae]
MCVVLAAVVMSCSNRESEKRIAELESRLAQLEGNKGATPSAGSTPAATTAPAPAEEKPEGPLPVAQFEKIEHDFGTIKEGGKVSYTYKLTNTGEAPLIIQNAQPSCGCTVPEWSREPIPVGGTGFVKAEFDTNGKQGINNKTITVTANTWPKTTTLRFKAMITPKADGANGPVK